MDQKNQNQVNVNKLLEMAGKKFNTDPELLKQSAQSGNLAPAIKNLKPADSAKLKQILQDPQLAGQMLNTPQARMLLQKLTEEK